MVDDPLTPILFSSGPTLSPSVVRSTRKAVKCCLSILAKTVIEVGDAAVGDELLGAVQDVVLAVGGEGGGRRGSQGVAAGARLGQAVGGNPFAGDDLVEIFFFLRLGPVIDQRQRADAGMGRVGDGEGPGLGELFRRQHAGGLVQFQPAVFLRGIDHQQPQLAALFHQLNRQRQIVMLDLLAMRENFIQDELFGRVADLSLLIGEILRREDVVPVSFGNQIFSAFE